jgi:catechol 2,3-dioxygenase-like lactoylglutathione lyase family enzyme
MIAHQPRDVPRLLDEIRSHGLIVTYAQLRHDPPMPRLSGSRTVLAVRNLNESTRFYIDVLGFQRDFGDGSDGWSFLSRDEFKVMLGGCPDEKPAGELGNHSYVAYIVVEGIDALYAELSGRGAAAIATPADESWGMREFGIRTPDGHRIRFGEPIRGEPS